MNEAAWTFDVVPHSDRNYQWMEPAVSLHGILLPGQQAVVLTQKQKVSCRIST